MAIEFNCPHCEQFLRTSDDKAGLAGECPACGGPITIPSRGPCPVCGAAIHKDARKCRHCGEEFVGVAPDEASTSLDPFEILHASWAKFKNHKGLAIGTVLAAALLQNLPIFALVIVVRLAKTYARQGGGDSDDDLAPIQMVLAAALVLLPLFCAAAACFAGGTIRVMLNIVRGRTSAFGDLFSLTIWTWFSMLIAGMLAFLCCLCFVPGIIAPLMLMPFPFLIVEEDLGVFAALGEAERLTRGHRFSVFLVGLLSSALLLAGAMACSVGLLFTLPLWWIMLTELYVRLKIRAGRVPEPARP